MTDRQWILERCATPSGFTPYSQSARNYLGELEFEGLVREAQIGTYWVITDAGRKELARLGAAT